MNILEVTETAVRSPLSEVGAPYVRGDRVTVTSPGGDRFVVRVEAVTPTGTGEFTLHGAVVTPRKFRSHIVSTVVDAHGASPLVGRAR